MTIGGYKLDCPQNTALPTTALLDTNLIVNSTISNHKRYGSKFCSIAMEFFLANGHGRPQIHSYSQKILLSPYCTYVSPVGWGNSRFSFNTTGS